MDRQVFAQLYRLRILENYRQHYDPDLVASIADSILKHGFKVQYPITVFEQDDSLIIIDGHTRYNACLLAARTAHSLNFGVWVVIVSKPDPKQFKLDQLAANELRSDPDDISKAIGYKQAIDRGATIQEICEKTGHKSPYITDRLSLLNLIPSAQELVAKKHLGIRFAAQLVRLDTNFQLIALKAYNAMKSPTLDEFSAVCSDLYTKQSQCSLFDLAIFSGKPIEEILSTIRIERQKSRAELLVEVETLKQARELDRQFARTKFQAALKEIERLKAQINLQKAG